MVQTDNGNVFGGFTSIPWTVVSENKQHADPTAFLYLIRSSANYQPQIFKNKGTNCAVYHLTPSSGYMFVYGSAGDIIIYSDCNNNKDSYVYAHPTDYNVPDLDNHYLNGGQRNFKVVDV
eukprot:544028_1